MTYFPNIWRAIVAVICYIDRLLRLNMYVFYFLVYYNLSLICQLFLLLEIQQIYIVLTNLRYSLEDWLVSLVCFHPDLQDENAWFAVAISDNQNFFV